MQDVQLFTFRTGFHRFIGWKIRAIKILLLFVYLLLLLEQIFANINERTN